MRPAIRRLTTDQVVALITAAVPTLTRKIVAVHLHHTWRPTRAQFKGQATVEAMRNVHVSTNGWDDIAQHLTIDPQGLSWTGRNWNAPPASQVGRNGTKSAGPFMIEIVGDFDQGRDTLDGDQRQAVADVVAAILHASGLATDAIFFHRDLGASKSCPGSGVDKAALLAEIQAALDAAAGAAPRGRGEGKGAKARAKAGRTAPFPLEFAIGRDVVAPWAEVPPGFETWEIPEHELAAQAVQDEARLRVRASLGETRDLAAALARTRSEWDPLRPHVVNLTQGRLSQGGEFEMPPGSIDAIVDAIEHYARGVDEPRVMLHAHGGLVSERSALRYALTAHRWWLEHGVFPVYFVWETSLLEIIRNRLGLGRGLGDVWDRVFEQIARPAGQPVWSEMKEYALLSSSVDAAEGEAGGARIFAQALSRLVQNPPDGKPIRLHAVGHSAGAIFHAHFVPTLNELGMRVESLALLAPAVRIDLFRQMVVPCVDAGMLARLEMYTMDEEAEKDDDLIEPLGVPVYGKSLLYLVSGAFEPEQDAGILGLQERLEDDDDEDAKLVHALMTAAPHRIEFSHARGKPHNPLTKARKHGCFDNDDATIRSALESMIGIRTEVPFPAADESCARASARLLGGVYPPAGTFAPPLQVPGLPAARATAGTSRPGRALCVGIDGYPTAPLAGCVRDARAWAQSLEALGFTVTTVLDGEATRQRVLDALAQLIDASRAGDRLVFQYAGHGTQAEDLNGDESDRYDEALVPIDYQSGALLLDDDLADLYRRLPDGAVLTLFMDCCHSGTNSRFTPIDRSAARGSERRRFLPLSPELEEAHRRFRARAGSPPPTSGEESLPGVIHFAACLDNQFAYESDGQGHFTRIATADLAAAVRGGMTNEDFGSAVAAKVIGLGRPQTPRLMRLPADLAGRLVLTTAQRGGAEESGAAPTATASLDDRAMAEWWLQFFEAGAAHWRQRLGR